jgi:hypothetical protein
MHMRRLANRLVLHVWLACAGDGDIIPDSPKMSWGALMRQKKAEKEQGIARMVRIKHATLVIQVCMTQTVLKYFQGFFESPWNEDVIQLMYCPSVHVVVSVKRAMSSPQQQEAF